MEPIGATELQQTFEKYVSQNLLNKVQICTSVPEKEPLIKR